MPLDTSGTPAAVSLIADPFAGMFAYASQMGDIKASDGLMNPIDAFPASAATGGLAVIIMNSLPTPLRLVESYLYVDAGAIYTTHAEQDNYPANTDGKTATDAHVIPAAQPYPRHRKHLLPSGGPAMMAGIGVYCFTASSYPRVDSLLSVSMVIEVARALSFSAAEDGCGPLVGVAIRTMTTQVGAMQSIAPYAAVTADLMAKNSGLDDFYANNMGKSENDDPDDDQFEPLTNQYDVGSGNDGITVWATYSNQPSKLTNVGYTLTVWVRNAGSTVGYIPGP